MLDTLLEIGKIFGCFTRQLFEASSLHQKAAAARAGKHEGGRGEFDSLFFPFPVRRMAVSISAIAANSVTKI